MKRILLLTSLLTLTCVSLKAQINEDHIPAVSLELGTDIGGAIPGFKFIPSVFKPYPKLNVSLGVGARFPLSKRVTLRTDVTYKTVTMGADAYVENQLAFVPDNSTETGYLKQYYTGQAYMNMSFTMFEVPVYVSIALGRSGNNKILVGGYGAWIVNSDFQTDPKKGYISDHPNHVGTVVPEPTPEVTMNFASVLSKWDAGLCVGYEFNVYKRFNLGFRFLAGFKDIFYDDVFPDDPEVSKVLEYRMTHMRGALYVSYDLFNGKGWWVNR